MRRAEVRMRSLRVLLVAAMAVLFVGALFASGTGEILRRSDTVPALSATTPGDDASGAPATDKTTADNLLCHLDVRCGGQSVTTATGPLVPPATWSAVVAVALLSAGIAVARAGLLLDRLASSRLFRPPRLAG